MYAPQTMQKNAAPAQGTPRVPAHGSSASVATANAPGRNQPERKIRSGAISATIWNNEQDTPNGKVAYKTVAFERSYKDKNGQWQTTNKLRGPDIPRAVLVLNKAYEHISLGEDAEPEMH